MKITIVACLAVIILTIVFVTFLLYYFKSSKIAVLQEIEKLQQEYSDKIAAAKELEKNISIEREQYESLCNQINETKNEQQQLQTNKAKISGEITGLKEEIETLNSIYAQNQQRISDVERLYTEKLKSIEQKFQTDLKNIIQIYEEKSEEYEIQLTDLREKRTAAIQTAIQEYEKSTNRNFYMLQLSNNDIEDIQLLRKLENTLHNKDILGKIIYKVYFEKPYTSLVGRVLDNKEFSGIYKITNELNQMCYVGQAVNIKKRWQQHIKRAVGAEALVNNKLYPAMIQDGVENFSFEVIDRCEKNKLNEREQYWQQFYQAKKYGYSIK